jgi:hypothetical protein
MKEAPVRFANLVRRHFDFLVERGFGYVESPVGFAIPEALGISNGKIEFIAVFDPYERVVDVYVRHAGESAVTGKRSYRSLLAYLVARHGYRGGFPASELEDPIERSVARYAALLRENLDAVLSLG